jgi:hypothetical protein
MNLIYLINGNKTKSAQFSKPLSLRQILGFVGTIFGIKKKSRRT